MHSWCEHLSILYNKRCSRHIFQTVRLIIRVVDVFKRQVLNVNVKYYLNITILLLENGSFSLIGEYLIQHLFPRFRMIKVRSKKISTPNWNDLNQIKVTKHRFKMNQIVLKNTKRNQNKSNILKKKNAFETKHYILEINNLSGNFPVSNFPLKSLVLISPSYWNYSS